MSTTANRYVDKNIYEIVEEMATNLKGNGTFITITNLKVPTTAWRTDTTYPNYPVCADIEVEGIDSTFSPDVRLGYQLEQDGIIQFASCLSDGVLTLYGSTGYESEIIIPVVIFQKVKVE